MRSDGLVTSLGGAAFAAVLVCLVPATLIFAQTGSLSASDPRAKALQALGEAYVKDLGLTLVKAEMVRAGTVDVPATWSKRLEDALAVGYSPTAGAFRAIPFSKLKSVMKVKAAQGRSPEDALKRVVTPGAVVVQTAWYFAGAEPVTSYAVFSPSGTPLFETMMSLPALRGPVFSVGHEP